MSRQVGAGAEHIGDSGRAVSDAQTQWEPARALSSRRCCSASVRASAVGALGYQTGRS